MAHREKRRRLQTSEGLLVASTDPVQYSCIKVLTIIHKYKCRNYKRIARYVQKKDL
jgi:hypothetical protein